MSGSIVIAGGRFAGGIGVNTSYKNSVTLTVGLYYWVEECSEVGGEWRQIGCQMATGNALTYYLFGSDGRSRYFRVGQSLSRR